jgi:hypothetical protein
MDIGVRCVFQLETMVSIRRNTMKSIASNLIATFIMGAAGLAAASVFACDGVCCQRDSSNRVQQEVSVFVVPPPSVGAQRQQFAGPQAQVFGPQGQPQFRSQVQVVAPQSQQFSGPQGPQQFRFQGQQFGPQGQQQFPLQGQSFASEGQQFSIPQGQQQFRSQNQQFDLLGQGFRQQGAPTGPQRQPSGPIVPQGQQLQFAPQGDPNRPQGQQLSSKPTTKSVNPKIAKALAGLTPEDRALAEKQGICPVTEELLGLMGTPVKVDVNGRSVFVCCGGCKEDLLAKPNEYLAKLKN